MIKKIEARNPRNFLLTLLMEDNNSGYTVRDVPGITPVRATIASSSFANLDGTQYHTARRDARNLVIKLGLEPVFGLYSVEQLRKNLYNFFMPKMPVALRLIMEDELEVDIMGRVETCEPDVFSEDPAVVVSIMCFDPDFFDRTPVILSGSTTAGTTETLIEYPGNSETGVLFTLNVDRTIGEFTIYLKLPSEELQVMEFEAPLVNGDVLKISTVRGNKFATLTRLGTTTPIVYGVSPQSSWFELDSGDNYIRVHATGAAIPYTLEWITKYGAL